MAAAPVGALALLLEAAGDAYRSIKARIRGQQAADQVEGQAVLDKAKADTAEIDEMVRKQRPGAGP